MTAKGAEERAVRLVPVGQVDARLLAELAQDLAALGMGATVGTPLAMPAQALDLARVQYRASVLLDVLRRRPGHRVLGVTDEDLYLPPLNFVFGLAERHGRSAVVSLYRLHGGGADRLRARLLKEAVHELGHTFGLEHCPRDTCVMHFSNTLADTDRKQSWYCRACQARLAADH